MRKILLDLYCGAGGAGKGYAQAGFDVIGVDNVPQPNYPFKFIRADAMTFPLDGFDAYHASPPCKGYTNLRHLHDTNHPLLIAATRERLEATGKPYVIENVEDAKSHMRNPIKLCGSAFQLRVRRHRLFESNVKLEAPKCDHAWQNASQIFTMRVSQSRGLFRTSGVISVHGGAQLHPDWLAGQSELDVISGAMDIYWMNKTEINQAIPPAYTKYIGEQIMGIL